MKDYIDWVYDEQEKSENNPIGGWIPPWAIIQKESEDSLLLDVILTRLRTKEGLDLRWVSNSRNGSEKVSAILKGAELGIELGLVEKSHDSLRLVDPDGFLFSNELIASIFYEVDLTLAKYK